MRRAKFGVLGHFDGKRCATLTIEAEHGTGWASVRPKGSRTVYALRLSDAVRLIMDRAAKETAAAQGIPVPMPRRGRP